MVLVLMTLLSPHDGPCDTGGTETSLPSNEAGN